MTCVALTVSLEREDAVLLDVEQRLRVFVVRGGRRRAAAAAARPRAAAAAVQPAARLDPVDVGLVRPAQRNLPLHLLAQKKQYTKFENLESQLAQSRESPDEFYPKLEFSDENECFLVKI